MYLLTTGCLDTVGTFIVFTGDHFNTLQHILDPESISGAFSFTLIFVQFVLIFNLIF